MGKHRRHDAGSVALEVAIVAPVLLLLLMLVMFASRVSRTETEVETAAAVAARAASQRSTADAAAASAAAVAESNLADAGIHCTNLGSGDAIAVDASDLRPGGTVTVTVTCVTDVSDLMEIGTPGQHTFSATSTEVVDTFRGGDS